MSSMSSVSKKELDKITQDILDCSFRLHTQFGPGLLESVYEVLLAHELYALGHSIERQKIVPAILNGIKFDHVFIADLVVDGSVVVELKAAERMHFVFERQLLTQLKVLNLRAGLVINFGMPSLKDGIRRVVNRI